MDALYIRALKDCEQRSFEAFHNNDFSALEPVLRKWDGLLEQCRKGQADQAEYLLSEMEFQRLNGLLYSDNNEPQPAIEHFRRADSFGEQAFSIMGGSYRLNEIAYKRELNEDELEDFWSCVEVKYELYRELVRIQDTTAAMAFSLQAKTIIGAFRRCHTIMSDFSDLGERAAKMLFLFMLLQVSIADVSAIHSMGEAINLYENLYKRHKMTIYDVMRIRVNTFYIMGVFLLGEYEVNLVERIEILKGELKNLIQREQDGISRHNANSLMDLIVILSDYIAALNKSDQREAVALYRRAEQMCKEKIDSIRQLSSEENKLGWIYKEDIIKLKDFRIMCLKLLISVAASQNSMREEQVNIDIETALELLNELSGKFRSLGQLRSYAYLYMSQSAVYHAKGAYKESDLCMEQGISTYQEIRARSTLPSDRYAYIMFLKGVMETYLQRKELQRAKEYAENGLKECTVFKKQEPEIDISGFQKEFEQTLKKKEKKFLFF